MKKRDLSGNDKEIIYLEIEKSRINREKGAIILNKSLVLYFVFMFVGIVGFIFEYIDNVTMNVLIIIGILLLFIGTLPYHLLVKNEETKINNYLKRLKK
jgi:hypothetical protein